MYDHQRTEGDQTSGLVCSPQFSAQIASHSRDKVVNTKTFKHLTLRRVGSSMMKSVAGRRLKSTAILPVRLMTSAGDISMLCNSKIVI